MKRMTSLHARHRHARPVSDRRPNRTFVLPLLIFYPTGRCNSRCVSCDWWQQSGADDLALDEIARARRRRCRRSAPAWWCSPAASRCCARRCSTRRSCSAPAGMTLHLLTSGVLLERFVDPRGRSSSAASSSRSMRRPRRSTSAIRGVDAPGDRRPRRGALRRLAPQIPVIGRATLHRANFRELPRLDRSREVAGARSDLVPAGRYVIARLRAETGADRDPARCSGLALEADEIRRVRGDHRADDRASTPPTSSPGSSPNRRRSCAGCRATTRALRGARAVSARVVQRAVGLGRRRGQRVGAPVLLSRLDRQRPRRRRLPRSSPRTCGRSASRSTSAPIRCASAACAR